MTRFRLLLTFLLIAAVAISVVHPAPGVLETAAEASPWAEWKRKRVELRAAAQMGTG